MRPKRDIHSTQSLVLNHTVHSKCLGLTLFLELTFILLKVGIPNSVCGCILGCKVLCTTFDVTVTFTSGLSHPRIIVSRNYLRQFRVGCILILLILAFYFRVTVTFTLTFDFGLLKWCVELSYTI